MYTCRMPNLIKLIKNGIMFVFYLGLPHIMSLADEIQQYKLLSRSAFSTITASLLHKPQKDMIGGDFSFSGRNALLPYMKAKLYHSEYYF